MSDSSSAGVERENERNEIGADPNRINKWDFFISYPSPEKKIVEELYLLLKPHARVFFDSRSLMAGDEWGLTIPAAMKQTSIIVVLISARTEQAYYQRGEIAAAVNLVRNNPNRHRLVPVFIDEASMTNNSVPYGLLQIHSLKLPEMTGLAELADKLLKLLSISNEKKR